VYAVAFGLAAGSVVFNPAAASVLPSVVADEELVAANSGLWSAAVISQIALAPLAGTLVAAWGVAPAFWVNAASFAVSAVALAGLRLPRPPAPLAAGRWRQQLVDGVRLLTRVPLLRLLAVTQLLAALSAGPPAPCWWCWRGGAWASARTALGCCLSRSAWARPSARCCWPG
jgi:hypothetical protein